MDTVHRLLLLHRTPLRTLTLSASTVAENAAAATSVGSLIGRTPGSTLSIVTQSNANWFALSGSSLVVGSSSPDFETNASPTVTIRETYPGSTQRDTVLTIMVTDVAEASYDPDAIALFARMSPEPDATRKGVINALIVALKADDVWDDLDVLYVLAAATAADAVLDWKNFGGAAAFNATLVSGTTGPVFTADRGYANVGVSDYVDTPYTPSTAGGVYTQNSAHMAVWSRTSGQSATSTSDTGLGLTVSPSCGIALRRSATGTTDFRINDATTSVTAALGDASGLYVANRPDASNKQMFRNGAQVGTDFAVASTAIAAAALRVNGRNTLNREMAAWSVGASLTAPKQSAYYTALSTYMTAVGAA